MIAEVTDDDRTIHRQFLDNMIRVCPSGSIQIKEGKAVHLPERCQTCLACVHPYPQKAMGLNVSEKNQDARYINEHINVKEIIDANKQILKTL